jgi:hypothetical protein
VITNVPQERKAVNPFFPVEVLMDSVSCGYVYKEISDLVTSLNLNISSLSR